VVSTKGKMSHNGIKLILEGSVSLQLSAKSVGLFEAFYNSVKPIQLVFLPVEVAKPGKFEGNKWLVIFTELLCNRRRY
jgi:hypothetical protein